MQYTHNHSRAMGYGDYNGHPYRGSKRKKTGDNYSNRKGRVTNKTAGRIYSAGHVKQMEAVRPTSKAAAHKYTFYTGAAGTNRNHGNYGYYNM